MVFMASITFAQFDRNPEYATAVVDSGDSNIAINLYNTFGSKGAGEWLKLVGIFTDTTMTSDTLTVQGYDPQSGTYKTIETEAGVAYIMAVEANKFYPLNKDYLRGLSRVNIFGNSAEAADRNITVVGKVEN